MAPTKSSTAAIHRKLKSIIFPKIDFRDSTIREALDFVVAKSKSLDPDGEGVNIVLKLGDGAGTPTTPLTPPDPTRETRITLTLNNVPLIEVIKYITNLANLKYKVEPFAVTIVPVGTATEELYIKEWKVPPGLLSKAGTATGILPAPGGAPSDGASNAKDFLAASGVAFGQGTFATYSPVSNSLVVKGTQDQLDLIERIIEAAATDGNRPAPGTSAGGKQLDAGGTNAVALALPLDGSVFGRKTAGLLPVTLDLPKNGRALVVEGLYAPERLVMRYEDWWSRAKHLWLWFVGGGLAFYVFAGRRHWLRTLWAMLLLSAVPLCVSPAWIPVCNALLGGWLVGLVLNRIAAWCVFRVRKEVLA